MIRRDTPDTMENFNIADFFALRYLLRAKFFFTQRLQMFRPPLTPRNRVIVIF